MKIRILTLSLLISGNCFSQNMYGLTYNTAIPLGETSDYINRLSARGLGFEGKYILDENVMGGFSLSWNIFYEELEGSFQDGTQTITGTQYRYINAFPLMLTFDYLYGDPDLFRPYGGMGFGAFWIEKRTDLGIFSETIANWHFGLTPELGVLFPLNMSIHIFGNLKYNVAFTSGDSGSHNYLGFNIGIMWH